MQYNFFNDLVVLQGGARVYVCCVPFLCCIFGVFVFDQLGGFVSNGRATILTDPFITQHNYSGVQKNLIGIYLGLRPRHARGFLPYAPDYRRNRRITVYTPSYRSIR